jgi:predicted amidophosphoribosyltransferase
MQCPVIPALRRRSGDYSQAGLNQAQRLQLTGSNFELKKGHQFHDKKILLIDDVLTTGSTLRKCAEQLYATYPSNIYGLTFCRAIK